MNAVQKVETSGNKLSYSQAYQQADICLRSTLADVVAATWELAGDAQKRGAPSIIYWK